MASFRNFGTIATQRLLEEFTWNEKDFYSYLISFNEYEGFFKIIRESSHEQALIGGQMLFNYCEEQERITKYRILGFKSVESKDKRLKQLLERRKQRENDSRGMAEGS